jgi:serine/threonine protein kinase
MGGNTLPLAPDARSLGKYEVLCRLSTGGMAEIFLASQRGLAGFRKLVVLKQILPDIRGEEEFVRMFLDEAKVTAAFNHPHIAQVYDLDIADGELFLSMEFVPGATLVEVARACRQANHPIPMGYSLMAVRDTAVALHYAHTFTDPLGNPSPVIHRDVAEKNIMVTYEGVTKLLDFGIAKSLARASRTAVGMVKGTSGYMSPEQIMGEPLDARSDLFSLGVVLHECLTGMRLFYAKQAEAMMNAVLRCEVTPPSRTNKQIPPELDAIVMRALAKRREDRYATTLEFARALERAVGPLIWHPEQSSELMRRLFADRREQTRQLLMSGQAASGDVSGELSVARVLAMGAEASEQPTGGAGTPQTQAAPPPPARASVTVPTVKAPAQAKPVTPPQGAPAPRRPTITAPTLPPAPTTEDAGTIRARAPVIRPPHKRLGSHNPPTEGTRPPPPPPEAMKPPPPPPDAELSVRTLPGRPALSPEYTVRAQQPGPSHAAPHAPESASSGSSSGSEEQPPRPRSPRTLEGIRTVAPPEPAEPPRPEARPRSRTHDNVRPATAPTPPPAERDLQTAMVRAPAPLERDLQTAMVRAPSPPPPPTEQEAPRAMARAPAPVERGAQAAMSRTPPPPPDRSEESVSITPTHTPRRSRRRSPPPHPFTPPDVSTEPVRAGGFPGEQNADDSAGAALGDDDAHENTARGIQAPPRKRRMGAWLAVTAVLLLGSGAAAVLLGWDGGRVLAVVKPALARIGVGPKAGTQEPGTAVAERGTPVKPAPGSTGTVPAAGVAPGTANPAPGTGTAESGADTGTAPAVAALKPGADTDPAGAGMAPTTPTDAARGEPLADPTRPAVAAPEGGAPPEESSPYKKTRNVAKRAKEAPARKPRASEEAASPAPEAGSETTPASEPGFLTLVTEPYAKVFLGGQALGDTPLFKVKLPSGKHALRLVDGNGKALRLPVDIKPGETTAVRIPLEMLSPQ